MKAGEGGSQTLIVAGETPEACGPAKGAFDHPSPWEKNQAALGLGKLDDFETDAMSRRVLSGGLTGIALIHKGHLDGLASGLLHRLAQGGDLDTVLFVGGSDFARQKMAQRVHGDRPLGAFALLGTVTVRCWPTSVAGDTVMGSHVAAERSALDFTT